MRMHNIARVFLLFSILTSTGALSAQFQQPTDEDLKMTADPKAPGAAAVYLYREETTDDALHYHFYYERIKVLTEKGKELATIRIPYERGQFKVTDIRGRTIHSDGSIYPLTAKPADLVDAKVSSFQLNTMVFTLPNVEVGSILEYRLEIRYDDDVVSEPTWRIQQPYFVHKAHYQFKPAPQGGSHYILDSRGQTLDRLMYAVTSVPISAVKFSQQGLYSVDLTDIPPTPSEDWMPPLNTINQRVEFYYTYAQSGGEFWTSEGKHWAKETERFTNPSGQLRKTAAEMVTPSDTDEQKARKIYAAVMKLDNTDFSRQKSAAERKAEKLKTIKDAEDVWKQQSGTGDEIALLYVALGRAAGLKVSPMQVVDRSRAIFDPQFLSARQVDDYLAVVDIGGKDVYLDPGQKMCPFGAVHWKHSLASGFRISEKGPVFSTTPAITYKSAVMQRLAAINVDGQGNVNGTIRYAMTGPEALRWRQLSLRNDTDEVKKQFNEFIHDEVPDGVRAEFDHFVGLDDPNVTLLATVNVTGTVGTATGKRMFLPSGFFESHASHPFVAQDKRFTPVDVQYARMYEDEVSYHLPAGLKVESPVQPTDLMWPSHAMLKIRSSANADGVTVTRSFAHNYTLLDPKEYGDLHDFYLKVSNADQQPIVLSQTADAKGN